jgi:hypothetical protein
MLLLAAGHERIRMLHVLRALAAVCVIAVLCCVVSCRMWAVPKT